MSTVNRKTVDAKPNMPISQRVAIARSRLVARRDAERARRILMGAGWGWLQAGRIVLDQRKEWRK